MERSNFTFYRSYYEALQELSEKDQTKVLMAVIAYALDGEEKELKGVPKALFTLIKPTLDAGRKMAKGGAKVKDRYEDNLTEDYAEGEQKADARLEEGKAKVEARSNKGKGNEIEIEKEIEIDIEKDIEGESEGEPRKAPKKKRDAFEEFAAVDKELLKALRDFEQMRTKIKKPLTERAKEMLIEKLKTFPPDHWVRILEQSVMHDWQGIFELKGEKQTYSKNDLRNIQPAPDTFMSKEERMKMMGGIK